MTEYTLDELIEAFNSVQAAEQTDEFQIYIWARYAKILADAFERVDGITKIAELADAVGCKD